MASGSRPELEGVTRVCQIIVFALAMGISSFAVVAIMQGLSREPDDTRMLTLMACGLSLVALVASAIVPRMIVAGQRRRLAAAAGPLTALPSETSDQEQPLAGLFQTKTIVGAALFEGAAFFALFAFLAESQPLALAAAGVMLLGVLSHFPVRGRVETWFEQQQRLFREERQLL